MAVEDAGCTDIVESEADPDDLGLLFDFGESIVLLGETLEHARETDHLRPIPASDLALHGAPLRRQERPETCLALACDRERHAGLSGRQLWCPCLVGLSRPVESTLQPRQMSEFLDKTRRLRMTGIDEMQLLPNCECLQVSRKMGLLQNRIKRPRAAALDDGALHHD